MERDFPAEGVALVVGGSGGLGRAICEALSESGAAVALTFRGRKDAADQTLASIVASGGRATSHQLDLRDPRSIERAFDEVASAHASIHTIVYAAGPSIGQPYISQVGEQEWLDAMDVELNGFFRLVKVGLPHLRATRGSLVALTSAGVHRYAVGDILSVAPKAGVEALVRGVAREEGRFGVRANCVAIGVVEAGLFLRLKEEAFSEQWLEAARKNTALRRFGAASEVGRSVSFLASSAAGFITGQTLAVDGGYSV